MRPLNPLRVRENIGRRIAERRAELGLTQAELAEIAEVTLRYVQAVEAASKAILVDSLVKFANALESPMATFFEPARTKKRGPGRPPKRA